MWEKKSDDGSIHDKDDLYTWSGASYGTTNVLDGTAATTFLAELNAGGGFAGHTDWRLPTLNELMTLVRVGASPTVEAAFNTACEPGCTVLTCSCTVPNDYWSSSTYAIDPQSAWYVGFYGGGFDGTFTFTLYKNLDFHVRAVRGGS